MSPAGTLHLVPVPIAPAEEGAPGEAAVAAALPAPAIAQVRRTRYFLVENARSARAFLKAAQHPAPIASLEIVQIGHEPRADAIDGWLAPLAADAARPAIDAALLSEAGCPGVADPGAALVARAHALGIGVRPWVGPSSILLALMGAGMNGQDFHFLGYLPQDAQELRRRLALVQTEAWRGTTQIFIETPYRNEKLFETLLQVCEGGLSLCVAVNLDAPDADLRTMTIGEWRASRRPELRKRPAVFLLHGRR
jgi:16S rRNA (cytidine1402-2'-O)-methyltransferase